MLMAAGVEQSTRLDGGTYRLTLRCIGHGSPAVVLDGNLRGSSSEWQTVRDKIATFTQVCTYEREGMAQPPLTSEGIAHDLHTLLHQAGVTPPYVLAGWAFGGYTARLFTTLYRHEVAGLVLVEALHEDFFIRYRHLVPPVAPGTPDPLQDFRYELAGGYRYLVDMEASADQVRAARVPLNDLPLAVLSRGDPDWPLGLAPELTARLEQTWQTMQQQLASLSSNSLHIVAADAGHLLQYDRPDVVVAAVQQVVEAARSGRPLRKR